MLLAFAGAGALARHRNQAYIESDNASEAYQRGDLNGAIAYAQHSVALKPDDAHTQFMLGTLLLNQRRYAEAEGAFSSTIRLVPDFGPAHVNLCAAQLALNQLQEALANCERGTQLSPNDAESWFNLGRVQYAMHNLTGARDALAKAVSLNPQGFDENLQYGLLLIADGENDKALPYLKKAHDLHPQDEDLTNMLMKIMVR
jgi:tetratricopeptide (TPR) repeat protein